MNEKMKRTLIVGAIATVLYIALGSIISQSISNLLFNNIGMGYEFARFIFAGLRLIEAVIAMIVAIMVNEKLFTYSRLSNCTAASILANIFSSRLPTDFFHTKEYLLAHASIFVPSIKTVSFDSSSMSVSFCTN